MLKEEEGSSDLDMHGGVGETTRISRAADSVGFIRGGEEATEEFVAMIITWPVGGGRRFQFQ